MIEIDSALLITLIELLALAVGGLAFLFIHNWQRNRRDRAAVKRLLAAIADGEEHRSRETGSLLQGKYGYTDKRLEEGIAKIVREEKRFYQTLINLYLQRDAGALEQLHLSFEWATEPYRLLEPSGEQKAVEKGGGEGVDSEEYQRLQEENGRLTEELRVTMDTIARMLNEYSSMYGGGAGADLDKEKMLESFQGEAGEAEEEGEADEVGDAGEQGELSGEESFDENETEGEAESAEEVIETLFPGTPKE